jgi:hypothetical protein
MKKDVEELMEKFDTNPKLKIGDLVFSAQIYRVRKINYGGEKDAIAVSDVFPEDCPGLGNPISPCKDECHHEYIYRLDKNGGQFAIMKLKGIK